MTIPLCVGLKFPLSFNCKSDLQNESPKKTGRSPNSINTIRYSQIPLNQNEYVSLVSSNTFSIYPEVKYRWFPNENSYWIETYKFLGLLTISLWLHGA